MRGMMLEQQIPNWSNPPGVLDDWNPRSLSSFQTFPRNSSPQDSGSSSSESSPEGVNRSSTRKNRLNARARGADLHAESIMTKDRASAGEDSMMPSVNGSQPQVNGTHHQSGDIDIVRITLGVNDRRFGFSVVGGSEEGFAPRIDEIAAGSPADKADLEIGDEILEVNGRSLEGATHTEVISHIHQCIRSRTICLRVKRRTGSKLAQDLVANSNVQDAFVIAVEKQARERLEKLSTLKKIKPVDMTKLSQQLSSGETPDSTIKIGPDVVAAEPSSSTAAAVQAEPQSEPEADGSQTEPKPWRVISLDQSLNLPKESIISPFGSPSTWNLPADSSAAKEAAADDREPADVPQQQDREEQEIWAHLGTPRPPPAPTSSLPRRLEPAGSAGPAGQVTVVSADISAAPTVIQGNKEDINNMRRLLSRIGAVADRGSKDSLKEIDLNSRTDKDPAGTKRRLWDSTIDVTTNSDNKISMGTNNNGNPSNRSSSGAASSRGTSQRSSGGSTTRSDGDSVVLNMAEWDTGPHREMAVDVPDSFVARTKTPPRYPPPKPAAGGSSLAKAAVVAQANVAVAANGVAGKAAASARDSSGSKYEEETKFVNKAPVAQKIPVRTVDEPSKNFGVEVEVPSAEELERIHKYQVDLKKRKEQEERMAKEDEFLRSSLRGSRKLQALESSPPVSVKSGSTGVVNSAYSTEHEDEDVGVKNSALALHLSHSNYILNSGLQKIYGIQEVTAALQRVQQQLKKNGHVGQGVEADLAAVQSLLLSPSFRSALSIHGKVQDVWCCGPPTLPRQMAVQSLVSECVTGLQKSSLPEAAELVELLGGYEFEGLLYAHDKIAHMAHVEPGPPDEDEAFEQPEKIQAPVQTTAQLGDRTVRIIRLQKTNEPLGATIRNEAEAVVIGRIVRGGVAERSGLLHEGDEILEINGIDVRGKSVNDVCDLVAGMSGTITFLIVPVGQQQPATPPAQPVVHLKAHFDYDPEDDLYIPCKELGISFQKGDILHVISQEDPNWWQAFREGEEDQSLAGLIPSKSFQQQREAMRQTLVIESMENEISGKGTLLCARKHNKKKKRVSYNANYTKDVDTEEILTYEEVALYYPRANYKRPIVLIGPPNIGRKEIRELLMHDSERFAPAIPHTSRPMRDSEVNGQGYHFISREQFEQDIVNRKFVEHGEYEKAYYGTTIEAIRAVVNAGKFCVLNLHPQSLKILKASDLMPFVVFVAPPSLEKLRAKNKKLAEPAKDEDLKQIIEKAREMEEVYGHFFDMVIVNIDEERTYNQLSAEVNRLEREPQWVPATWLQ